MSFMPLEILVLEQCISVLAELMDGSLICQDEFSILALLYWNSPTQRPAWTENSQHCSAAEGKVQNQTQWSSMEQLWAFS